MVCAPGTSRVALFVFVIARSPDAEIVSVSVSLLLFGAVSGTVADEATVAVLTSDPLALLTTVAFTLKVAILPGRRLTVVLMLPAPLGLAQLPPAVAVHVQRTLVSFTGMLSVTVAPITVLGPVLRTVMV